MELKQVELTEKTTQEIQLVKGEFTTSEALDVVCGLIDKKINFHKLQRLQLWEGSHDGETGEFEGRIKELQEEKQIVKEFITQHKGLNRKLKIHSVLEISVVD